MSKKQKQQQHVSCASSTSTSATNGYNASSAINFNAESLEYYPPACCEILHVTNAVYLATVLQILFVVLLSIFYHFLERNNFIVAVEIFRPAVIFIICVNAVGIVCALIGILLQQDVLVSAQIALLAALCVLADLVALALVGAMAFGGGKWRQPQTVAFVSDDATTSHHHQQHQQQQQITVSGRLTFAPTFIDERRFEAVLGAFWIYLVAILFHMCAAAIMCVIGVYRRYGKFLKDKFDYSQVHNIDDAGIAGVRNHSECGPRVGFGLANIEEPPLFSPQLI